MNLPSCIRKVEQSTEKEDLIESNPGPSKDQLNPSNFKCQKSVTNNEELLRVDDARMCKICYSEELGVVFLPCGHMVACVKCAPGMTSCAVCRVPVTMTVRAFFS